MTSGRKPKQIKHKILGQSMATNSHNTRLLAKIARTEKVTVGILKKPICIAEFNTARANISRLITIEIILLVLNPFDIEIDIVYTPLFIAFQQKNCLA